MKHQQVFEPQSGNLVCQFLGAITFANYLHLGHSRNCCKGVSKEKNIYKVLHHSFGNDVP